MPTSTTNYSLQKPLVNDPTDEDLWGGYINDDMDDIDTLLRAGICNTVASSQTTGFTAVSTISTRNFYPCNATGGAFAATLPTAASAGNGATVVFKKTDSSANAVTITRAGADTIDGATTKAISTQYDTYALVSDGTSAWQVLISPAPTPTPPNIGNHVVASAGAFTWTTPSDITTSTKFKLTLTGGGGAGGGNSPNSCGGGGGATCIVWVTGLSPSTGYNGVIGAGGAGSTSATGADGVDTTITIGATTYTAGKGAGGGQGSSIGLGGTATNGTINISGGDGGEGITTSPVNIGGEGGGTMWGQGGGEVLNPSSSNGRNSKVIGGGGSGSSLAGGTSGSGKEGIFIAEWVV